MKIDTSYHVEVQGEHEGVRYQVKSYFPDPSAYPLWLCIAVNGYLFSAGAQHDYHYPGVTLCGVDLTKLRELWPYVLVAGKKDPKLQCAIDVVLGNVAGQIQGIH